jgi:citronellol/citronellal dehydrogenase
MSNRGRKPEIVADAAHVIFTQPGDRFTGHFCIDEDVLRMAGTSDFTKYAVDPSKSLQPDFFIEANYKTPQLVTKVNSKL